MRARLLALPTLALPSLALAQGLPPGSCFERAYSDAELAEAFSPVRFLQVYVADADRGTVPPEGGALVVLSALLQGGDALLVGSFACGGAEGAGLACDLGDGVGFDLRAQEDGTVLYRGPVMALEGVPLVAPPEDLGTHVLAPVDPEACL